MDSYNFMTPVDEQTTRNIDIAIDAGPLLFRRRLQKLIDTERHLLEDAS